MDRAFTLKTRPVMSPPLESAGHIHELQLPGLRDRHGDPLLHDVAYYTMNQIPAR